MSEKIFPQYLKPAGYATAQFGKWHLGATPEWSPALRGFDEVFGFLGCGAHDYFKFDDPEDPIYRGTNAVKETGYLTDRLGEETAAFITRNKARPFSAYLAFKAVHAPRHRTAREHGPAPGRAAGRRGSVLELACPPPQFVHGPLAEGEAREEQRGQPRDAGGLGRTGVCGHGPAELVGEL